MLGIGAEIERFVAEGTSALLVSADADGRADGLVDALRAAVGDGDGEAVLVAPAWLGDEAGRDLRLARGLVEGGHIGMHFTDLPPLAHSALVALAAGLVAGVGSAGELLAALPAVERSLQSFAWAASVSSLKRPSPSLRQHARSAVPRSAFFVSVAPQESVHDLPARNGDLPIAERDEDLSLLVAGEDEVGVAWILDVANAALGGLPTQRVEPSPLTERWWGTKRVVEAVAVPATLDEIAAAVPAIRLAPCGWCGEPVAATPCAFCGHG